MRYRVPSNSIECLLITPVTYPFLKLAVDLLLGDFTQTESPMLYVHGGGVVSTPFIQIHYV